MMIWDGPDNDSERMGIERLDWLRWGQTACMYGLDVGKATFGVRDQWHRLFCDILTPCQPPSDAAPESE
jgi:hypothetical protein